MTTDKLIKPKGIAEHGEKYRWAVCVNRQRRTGVCDSLEDAIEAM